MRRYSPEAKAAAVRMVRALRAELRTEHGAVYRVVTQLGYGIESVRMWVKRADIDDGAVTGVSAAEARRVGEFEREVPESRRASEIVKRAASFFGAELDRQHRKQSRSSARTRTTSSRVVRSESRPSARCCRWLRATTASASSARARAAPGSPSVGIRLVGSCAPPASTAGPERNGPRLRGLIQRRNGIQIW